MNVGDGDSKQNGAKIGDNMSSISSGKKNQKENKRKNKNTKEQSVKKEKSISSLHQMCTNIYKCKMKD